MLTYVELKAMCKSPGTGRPYFRPLVCKGELSEVEIFVVGINPATPMGPDDLSLDEYAKSLLDYQRFQRHYTAVRAAADKTDVSPTRRGINAFVAWLAETTNRAVAETNVIPFPTKDVDDLDSVPGWIKNRGRQIFLKLLLTLEPELLILHGNDSVKECVRLLEEKSLLPVGAVNTNEGIRLMETRCPLCRFTYPTGKECRVATCRHLRYYGDQGKSFEEFRMRVQRLLSSG